MWQKPKTDWQASDFFNIEDYNRIKGNLNEIRTQALAVWPTCSSKGGIVTINCEYLSAPIF